MGSYSIQNQAAAKKLMISVEGTFQQTDVQNFVASFNKEIRAITASQYELVFDCSKLNVSTQQMLPALQNCMELYKKLGFKKITINTFGNAILKMQMQKVVTTVNITNTTVL